MCETASVTTKEVPAGKDWDCQKEKTPDPFNFRNFLMGGGAFFAALAHLQPHRLACAASDGSSNRP